MAACASLRRAANLKLIEKQVATVAAVNRGGSTGSKPKTARPACHLNIQLGRLAKEKLNKTEQQ